VLPKSQSTRSVRRGASTTRSITRRTIVDARGREEEESDTEVEEEQEVSNGALAPIEINPSHSTAAKHSVGSRNLEDHNDGELETPTRMV
jgi:hypothetical protein